MAIPELSRKAAKIFAEYRVPMNFGFDWAFEIEDAKSENDLSLELQSFLAEPYFMNPKPKEVEKHLPGQHDQSTHGGRKSYKSIDDLVKDGLSMQEAVDGLGGASVGNGNVAMRILLERTGKGGKPEVVASVADLDGEPIYRGVPTSGADSLVNADYDRIGTGQYGDGYYFSNQQGTAQLFADMAKEQFKGDKGEIVVAGWKKDAKVFNVQGGNMGWIDAATSAQNNAIDKLNINTRASDDQSAIFDLFYQDYGNSLATDLIMQGYDGMNIGINALESYTVVFNREALQVVSN
jgi:hypothetical protein